MHGWKKLHQPVEEDTQAFAGREEAAVEKVELVIILHEELQSSLIPAGGTHCLQGWKRGKKNIGRERRMGGKDEIYGAAHAGQPYGLQPRWEKSHPKGFVGRTAGGEGNGTELSSSGPP